MQNLECSEHHFQMTEYIVACISLLQQGTGKSNRSLLFQYERWFPINTVHSWEFVCTFLFCVIYDITKFKHFATTYMKSMQSFKTTAIVDVKQSLSASLSRDNLETNLQP